MAPSSDPSRARRALVAALVVGAIVGVGFLWAGGSLGSSVGTSPGEARLVDATADAPSTTRLDTTTSSVPTTTTTVAPTTTTVPPSAAADGTLELGEEGPEVAALQTRLDELGYWHGGSDGHYGQLTRQAVMAFQKAEGLGRDGVAGPITQFALGAAARVAPADASGTHLEIDLSRQILLVVEGGQTKWVINTSTGTGEAYAAPSGGSAIAATPTGRFTIQRQVDGLREAPLGTLYRPKYFVGGIAIHGSGSIPAQPASHGCARVTNSAMDLLWSSGLAPLGALVLVH